MNSKKIRQLTAVTSVIFGLSTLVPFMALAQLSSSSVIGQTIDASRGALTMPCSLGDFSLTSIEIGDPSPLFSGYYINPKTSDTNLSDCGGTGITVQDTRYDGGFVLQVTATDYVKVGSRGTVIPVENLAIVTEQVGTSYNEGTVGLSNFQGTGDTLVPGTTGDNVEANFTLPFTFTFYGTNYTEVWLCSNGEINFSSGECNSVGGALTDRFSTAGARILPYYKDLTTDTNIDNSFGIFEIEPSATEIRFRWKGAPATNTSERVEFEVTLTDNGTEDEIAFDYSSSNMTDSATGPSVGITRGGAAANPVSNTYTESSLSQHEAGSDLNSAHAIFVPAGFDFTEVKKPGTPEATATQNGRSSNDADYVAFTEDGSNPGTSLAIDLINATVEEGCSFTPGRVGIYTVYPSYRLSVPNDTPEGTYESRITYTVSDSTEPPPSC